MGRNRVAASPEAYPAAFLSAIEHGAGLIYAHDLPWSTTSARKRFYACLSLLRNRPAHWLHDNASKRWSAKANEAALELTMHGADGLPTSVAGPLIDRALST